MRKVGRPKGTRAKDGSRIPPPVDVIGRKVSWKPEGTYDRLYGEVVKVKYKPEPDPRYPGTCLRQLVTMITVEIPDGRLFTLRGEQEDLKKIKMVAE